MLAASYHGLLYACYKRLEQYTEPLPPEIDLQRQILQQFVRNIAKNLYTPLLTEIDELQQTQRNLSQLLLSRVSQGQFGSQVGLKGGQPQNLKDLVGKLVIYKYDKKENKY